MQFHPWLKTHGVGDVMCAFTCENSHLIQILLPLRVKYWPKGKRTAVVLMGAASDPLPGSGRQKATIFSPIKDMQDSQCIFLNTAASCYDYRNITYF